MPHPTEGGLRMDSSRIRQCLAALALLAAAIHPLAAADLAEKHLLKSHRQPHELTRVEVAVQMGGDLKLVTDGQPKQLPMSVVANLKYDEQLLATDDQRPTRAIRYYDDARAVIKVDKGGEKPALDNAHRLIAVEKQAKRAAVLYCPAAPLAREELDLIDVPGNSMLVDQLLPAEAIALGQSWKLSDQGLCELLGLDAVSWTDVESVLGEITEGVAHMAAAGSVSGAVGGVSTEIELKAKYRFNLKQQRVTYLALLIKEKRAVGHIGPGLDTVAKLIMTFTPLASSEHLSQAALATVPDKLTPEMLELSHTGLAGGFRFEYDRRWYLTSEDPKLAVLRLLDRGELVAQCNVSPLPNGQKSSANLAEFQHDVQDSLGKNFGQFVNASQGTNDAGYTVLRVVARGVVSQLPIEWIYYLITDGKGQRVTLAFTFEQDLEERFAQADRVLVSQLRLTEPPAPTAAKPPAQAVKAK
jgi:hypothetical protein